MAALACYAFTLLHKGKLKTILNGLVAFSHGRNNNQVSTTSSQVSNAYYSKKLSSTTLNYDNATDLSSRRITTEEEQDEITDRRHLDDVVEATRVDEDDGLGLSEVEE